MKNDPYFVDIEIIYSIYFLAIPKYSKLPSLIEKKNMIYHTKSRNLRDMTVFKSVDVNAAPICKVIFYGK